MAPQEALPRRVLATTDAVRFPVHPIKRVPKGGQVRAGPNIHLVLERVVDKAHSAELLNVPLTPDVIRVPTAPRILTTRAMAVTGRSRLLPVLLNGSVPDRCLTTDGSANGTSAELFGVEEGPPRGNVLRSGDWWGRAASITRSKPWPLVDFFG